MSSNSNDSNDLATEVTLSEAAETMSEEQQQERPQDLLATGDAMEQQSATQDPPPPLPKDAQPETLLAGADGSPPSESAQASSSAGPSSSTALSAESARTPRSHRKRRLPSQPRSILKPAPPPQKTFSFRRDILQTINSRLVQQGVYIPMPGGSQAGTTQAAGNLIGGVFRRIGGMAAGAVAAAGAPVMTDEARAQQSRATSSTFGAREDAAPPSKADPSSTSLSGLSDTSQANPTTSVTPLKRVQFAVSTMTVTYPIVGTGTPGDEDVTRVRIEKEHRERMLSRKGSGWKPYELEQIYRECCRTREEHPLLKMRSVFLDAARASPPGLRTLDLSLIPLDRGAVEPIADLLSVEFGLTKLVLENCSLTDETLKPILHALLVSGTLPNLSVASNRKIKNTGWRYVAIFMRRAQALRYLDLSENTISRPALEHIVQALVKSEADAVHPVAVGTPITVADVASGKTSSKARQMAADEKEEEYDEADALALMPGAPLLRRVVPESEPLPPSALISLRMENCGLKTAALDQLAQGVRTSNLKHLSLRRNRISQLGAVALAQLLKDYPSTSSTEPARRPGVSTVSRNGTMPPPAARSFSTSSLSNGLDHSKPASPLSIPRPLSPDLHNVPVVVSSPGGGVTSRRMMQPTLHAPREDMRTTSPSRSATAPNEPLSPGFEVSAPLTDAERESVRQNKHPSQSEEEAIALFQAQRATRLLADLPRIGNLLTLDLKSNDIRTGVSALAHVLRKNRTLRVLNLSDNNIDMSGLVALAEALKYNSTLETLDVSHNPCAGPGLEGITRLRTAFTTNSNLKRLFLNDTDLSSEGAIALAEYLPEAQNLLHLDMTENYAIDIAGVLALAVAVKMNRSLRCLDLNIPPNSPDFAQLSQDILQSCVRNTEAAQRKAALRGSKAPVAAPIYKSVVARAAKEEDDRVRAAEASRLAQHHGSNGTRPEVPFKADRSDVIEEKRDGTQLQKQATELHSASTSALAEHSAASGTHSSPPLEDTTFSIGDEDDEDEEANAPPSRILGRRADVADSAEQVDATEDGEPSLDSLTETPTAPREQDSQLATELDREPDEVEVKARSLLSEEGEIFRKAKQLGLDEDAADDKDEAGEADGSGSGVGADASASTSATTNARDEADDTTLASTSSSISPSPSSLSTSLSTSTISSSASGDELRKDLLSSDLPKDTRTLEEEREQSVLAEA